MSEDRGQRGVEEYLLLIKAVVSDSVMENF